MPHMQPEPSPKPVPPPPSLDLIAIDAPTSIKVSIPGDSEVAAFSQLFQGYLAMPQRTAAACISTFRQGLELWKRLDSDELAKLGRNDPLGKLRSQHLHAESAARFVAAAQAMMPVVFVSGPQAITNIFAREVLTRIAAAKVKPDEDYSASVLNRIYETSQLLMRRACGAVSEAQLRSSAAGGVSNITLTKNEKPTKLKDRGDWRANAQKRSEERKAALRSGLGVGPQKKADPTPDEDLENELAADAVKAQSAILEDAAPSDEHRRAFASRGVNEIHLALVKSGVVVQKEGVEDERVRIIQNASSALQSWIEAEVSYLNSAGEPLTLDSVKSDPRVSAERNERAAAQLERVQKSATQVTEALTRLSKHLLGVPGLVEKHLNPEERALVKRFAEPPKKLETYDLA